MGDVKVFDPSKGWLAGADDEEPSSDQVRIVVATLPAARESHCFLFYRVRCALAYDVVTFDI